MMMIIATTVNYSDYNDNKKNHDNHSNYNEEDKYKKNKDNIHGYGNCYIIIAITVI